ncbi:MAG: hypothetical protein QM804_13385 [Propionicimonas sp.]
MGLWIWLVMAGVGLVGYLIGRTQGMRGAQREALPPPMPPAPGGMIAPPVEFGFELSDEVRKEIGRLLAQGRKIEAIKVYREATRLGLKESKEAIDYWESRGEPTSGDEGQWPQLPSGPAQ